MPRGGGGYTYWVDGSLKSDESKEITNIIYDTYLKKPIEIQLTGNRWIKMYYDGSGKLLKRVFSTGEYWEFVGSLIFKNGQPFSLSTPEGRALYENGNGWVYEFFYKDHLGNSRVSFRANGNQLEKTSETAFDPTGIELLGVGQNSLFENRFKHQNKESLALFGLGNIEDFGARYLDKSIMRWWGTDEMSEKYASFSPYNYVSNNPINRIDPDGRDGILVIRGNNIIISSNIYIYGSGATRATASQMQSDIMSKWDRRFSVQGSNGNAFSVKFDVKVGLYGGKEKSNPLVVPESWNPNNRDNFIEVGASLSEVGRSFVSGGDEGKWRGVGRNGLSLSKDDPAPHEFGHILGLDDRYDDKNGAFKGWEKNIMGDSQNGNVEQRNVQSIVGDAMKAYDTWSKDKNNAGKEFRYEINIDRPNKEKQ